MMSQYLKKIALLMLIGLPAIGLAQTTYQFSFDNAGNRVKREVVFLESSMPNKGTTSMPSSNDEKVGLKNKTKEDKVTITESEVTLYPNPTIGSVMLHIPEDFNAGRLQVISSTGKVVFETNKLESEMEINLSNDAAGNYLVRLYLDNEEKQWVVVKK